MKKVFVLFIACVTTCMLYAQDLHWTPVQGGFEDYMSLTSVIQIDGVEQASDQLEVGAFCGEECRGAQMAVYWASPIPIFPSRYVVYVEAFGQTGESITFKLFDHSTNQELDLISPDPIEWTTSTTTYNELNPFILSFTTPAAQTYTLPITGYGTSTGGYYLIASPIDGVNPAEVEGMTTGNYDLYYFDEGETDEWRNYEASPFNLTSGKGYLYAHSTDVTLTFSGTPYSGNGNVTLSKTAGAEFSGWNLVGNPFTQTAGIDRDCYVMKSDGTEIIASTVRIVNPMQGVFVIAAEDNEVMTFIPQNNTEAGAGLVLNVIKDRANTVDRAIIRFEGNGSLPKFMLHPNNTKIYIPQDNTDYAVVRRSSDNVTPVSFKASSNGTYTLNMDVVNLDLDYLHLIDNKTGADIDLLQTPGYTFEANTTDYAERFKLVYATTTGINEGNEPFAYYADGEIRLVETSHGVSLQIVDMTGRVVRDCKDGVHTVSTAEMTPGVYVLRLEDGDNVKVQKIVIK